MYALSDITSKKKDGTLSSTSNKCVWDQFNNPRKRKLTPKKASELTFRKYTFESETAPVKKPVSKELFKSSVNEEKFRLNLLKCNPCAGWLLNFVEEKVEEEIPKFLNVIYNFMDNVNLRSTEVNETLSDIMDGLTLTESECEMVEQLTRGQGKSIVWQDERKTRLTASNFGEVMSLKSQTAPEGPIKRFFYSSIRNKYMTWGIKHEPAARRKYVLTMKKTIPDITVTESGLCVKGDVPYLGASPDGIINYTANGQTETGVLEIKCPASDKWKILPPIDCAKDADFYCEINPTTNMCKLKVHHKYYYQVQGQMALTGKKWCDFVVWTLAGISIERIAFNEECWSGMFIKLKDFYLNAVLPELFSRRVQRGLKLYD